ncbi:MAG: YkgJ family cysteine cluster protein [Bacteroidales bacterium]
MSIKNGAMISQEKLKELAASKESQNKKFFKRLKAKTPRDLDEKVHKLHTMAFSEIDCLDCAYCCKHLGPRILEKDIERISKYLKIKKDNFIQQYLRIDEDGDYVFQSMPCPFLQADNYCSVYEARPKACREYPHTDRRKFHQIFPLTIKNTITCPAVYEIVENLKKIYS